MTFPYFSLQTDGITKEKLSEFIAISLRTDVAFEKSEAIFHFKLVGFLPILSTFYYVFASEQCSLGNNEGYFPLEPMGSSVKNKYVFKLSLQTDVGFLKIKGKILEYPFFFA